MTSTDDRRGYDDDVPVPPLPPRNGDRPDDNGPVTDDDGAPDGDRQTAVEERFAYARIDFDELFADEDEGGDWLVEPLIPRGRSVALYAPGKTGKSILVLEVAAALA